METISINNNHQNITITNNTAPTKTSQQPKFDGTVVAY